MERYIAGLDYDSPNCADSTTEDTPVKNPPRAPKKSKPTKSAKKKAADARKESSIARANQLLDSIKFSEDSNSSDEDEKDVEIKRLKKELVKMRNQQSLSCEWNTSKSWDHMKFHACLQVGIWLLLHTGA